MRQLALVATWIMLCLLKDAQSNMDGRCSQHREPLLNFLNSRPLYSTEPATSYLKTYRGVTKHPISNEGSVYNTRFRDPRWNEEWYMHDYRTEDMPVMDLNLVPVFDENNSGQDVTICVIGDGVDGSHPDLHYYKEIAYDACKKKKDAQPSSDKDMYGTLVAGLIGMQPNNELCGVGVAYSAKITGLKGFCSGYPDYPVNESFTYNLDTVDIYVSAISSKYFHPRSEETTDAMDKGYYNGRKYKGAIYIFPAGNGGHNGESCAGRAHMNHMNVIGVNGASQAGKVLSYGERCAAIFATAYAAENNGVNNGILSTSLSSTCNANTVGTWSAAGFAAGIIALVLKANNKLKSQDVMHIITQGAEVAPLADNDNTWQKNAAGFWVSKDFGFGLLNAQNMVNLAHNWTLVSKPDTCYPSSGWHFKKDLPATFNVGEWFEYKMGVQFCPIIYLEQVIINLNIKFPYRGALEIRLLSPRGTEVELLKPNLEDTNTKGIMNWRFKSVHYWGENPRGDWKLRVIAKSKPHSWTAKMPWIDGSTVELEGANLLMYGLRKVPQSLVSGRQSYSAFRLKNGASSHPDINNEMYVNLGTFSTRPSSTSLSLHGTTQHPVYDPTVEPSAYGTYFNDLIWFLEWFVQDYRLEDSPVMDLNVVPVYKMGITGKNVNIAIVSDGVFSDHLDIKENYLQHLSINTCNNVEGATPYNEGEIMGTLTAGLIAMQPNNKLCGVGIAHGAKIAGIKIYCFGGWGNDNQVALSLTYKLNDFDIYNHAWNSISNGPLPIATQSAIENGLQLGRRRKGVIHVFPSGTSTGGSKSCAGDPLLNHHGVITVNGASKGGKVLSYGQWCAAILAAAYAAQSNEERIYSTTSKNECVVAPRGTYTAAAFASGIIALLLEANNELTYRDVMHIITMGAEVAPLADNPTGTWYQNHAGFWVSRDFGFGLLNAENMVLLAQKWDNVPNLLVCTKNYVSVGADIEKWAVLRDMELNFDACRGTDDEILYLERVEVTFKFQFPLSTLEVHLKSPKGTNVVLHDGHSTDGVSNLTIGSVHTWGEDPEGKWKIDFMKSSLLHNLAQIEYRDLYTKVKFTAYGTHEQPAHYVRLPRSYTAFRLRDGQGSGSWGPRS